VILLDDGRRVSMRRATDADRGAIVALYEDLSETSRYQRFFHPTPRLTAELVAWLTDLRRSAVWLAFDGETCIGESRVARYHEARRADLAVTVADAYQRSGVGRRLARAALAGWRRRGGDEINVSILPDNVGAIRLARRAHVDLAFDGGVLEGQILPRPHPNLQEIPMLPRHDRKLDHLAEIDLFHRCTRRQLHELSKLTTELDVDRGTVLCREGEIGRECFVVGRGEATVTIAGEHVATLGPGEFFGELALLDGERRVATVTAATDMGLVVLSRRDFETLLDTVPIVSRQILREVGHRLRVADAQLHTHRLSA
jgi:CRP/FNR family transcriptional regulator, cyclic AMP receptor protein